MIGPARRAARRSAPTARLRTRMGGSQVPGPSHKSAGSCERCRLGGLPAEPRVREAARSLPLPKIDSWEAIYCWLYRGHFDLVGHDKSFFANQGHSAVEQHGVRIIVTNQFITINRTSDCLSVHFEFEVITF
jgi:hypothetical protein